MTLCLYLQSAAPKLMRIAITALLGLMLWGTKVHAEPCQGMAQGQIVDAYTGAPMPGIWVYAHQRNSQQHKHKHRHQHKNQTDLAGQYRLSKLCPGTWQLSTTAPKHAQTQRKITLSQSNPSRTVHMALLPMAIPTLAEVVVQGDAATQSIDPSAISLDASDLNKTLGSTLADALQAAPGVAILESSSSKKPSIRGHVGRRVVLVLDGIRHAAQTWGIDHGPEIDPFAAGSINIVRDPQSLLYGTDAQAGAVVMQPHPWRKKPGLGGKIDAIMQSNGLGATLAGRIQHVLPKSVGLSWRLDGNVQRNQDMRAPGYLLPNTAGQTFNVGGEMRWQAPGITLSAAFRQHGFGHGICLCIRSANPESLFIDADGEAKDADGMYRNPAWRTPAVAARSSSFRIERPRQSAAHTWLRLRARIALPRRLGELETTYALQRNHRQEFAAARDSITRPQADMKLYTHHAKIHWIHSGQSHKSPKNQAWLQEGRLGLELRWQDHTYAGLPLLPNYQSIRLGFFALQNFQITQSLDAKMAARIDVQDQQALLGSSTWRKLQNRNIALGPHSPSGCDTLASQNTGRCKRLFVTTAASASATWRIDRFLPKRFLPQEIPTPLAITWMLTYATRIPAMDALYLDGTAPSLPIFAQGDPTLDPEQSISGSVALRSANDFWDIQLAAFGQFFPNYINFAPALDAAGDPIVDILIRGSFPRYAHPQIPAAFWGGEAQVSWLPGEAGPWGLDLQTSWVQAQDLNDGGFVAWIPPHRYTATLYAAPPPIQDLRDVRIGGTAKWVMQQNRSDPGSDLLPPPKGYATVALFLDAKWAPSPQGPYWSMRLQVENVLNTRFRSSLGLARFFADAPGRRIQLSVSKVF